MKSYEIKSRFFQIYRTTDATLCYYVHCIIVKLHFKYKLNIFSVVFALYHFVSNTKYSVSLQSKTCETNLFFAVSLRSFCFVLIPSEMRGHPKDRQSYCVYCKSQGREAKPPPEPKERKKEK